MNQFYYYYFIDENVKTIYFDTNLLLHTVQPIIIVWLHLMLLLH